MQILLYFDPEQIGNIFIEDKCSSLYAGLVDNFFDDKEIVRIVWLEYSANVNRNFKIGRFSVDGLLSFIIPANDFTSEENSYGRTRQNDLIPRLYRDKFHASHVFDVFDHPG